MVLPSLIIASAWCIIGNTLGAQDCAYLVLIDSGVQSFAVSSVSCFLSSLSILKVVGLHYGYMSFSYDLYCQFFKNVVSPLKCVIISILELNFLKNFCCSKQVFFSHLVMLFKTNFLKNSKIEGRIGWHSRSVIAWEKSLGWCWFTQNCLRTVVSSCWFSGILLLDWNQVWLWLWTGCSGYC